MNRIFLLIFLSYIFFILFVSMDVSEANETLKLHRTRRFLSFRNTSQFFIRLNFKANMVRWNQIFAQALGFRLNYHEPPDTFHPYHHLNRRTAYTHLETILERSGLNGFYCVRRAICESAMLPNSNKLYFRVLKIIFRKKTSATEKWHNVAKEECQKSIISCPFSFLDVSRYTDL